MLGEEVAYLSQEAPRERAQQRRGSKAKTYQENGQSQRHGHNAQQWQQTPVGHFQGKGKEKAYHLAQGSPSQKKQAAVPPPPMPLKNFPQRNGKQKHLMVMCSKCMNGGVPCNERICPDYAKGQCKPGDGGTTCEHGLCHSCEGNVIARNVPKPKFNKISLAVQEHRQLRFMFASGCVVKNGFFDAAGSMDEDKMRRQSHSAPPDRSKDLGLREYCHHCVNDHKRAQGILHGRYVTRLLSGDVRMLGPQVDTTWMEADADPRTLPLYVLSSFMRRRSRDSAGSFDPLGLHSMCQKAILHGRYVTMLLSGDVRMPDLMPQEGTLPLYVLSSFMRRRSRDSAGSFDPLGLSSMCQKAHHELTAASGAVGGSSVLSSPSGDLCAPHPKS